MNLTRVFSDPREKEFQDHEESLPRTGGRGRRILSTDLVLCLQRQGSGLLAREPPPLHFFNKDPRQPPGPWLCARHSSESSPTWPAGWLSNGRRGVLPPPFRTPAAAVASSSSLSSSLWLWNSRWSLLLPPPWSDPPRWVYGTWIAGFAGPSGAWPCTFVFLHPTVFIHRGIIFCAHTL